MGSYTYLLYQIVFCPKYRNPCMVKENRQQVFAYMSGIIKNKGCKPFIVNGVDDHVHILTHIHQTMTVAKLVAEIKKSSHAFIDRFEMFPEFTNWQNGYAAFTYSKDAFQNLLHYIANQEAHHSQVDFKDEYIGLLTEFDMPYEEKYLFE